MVELPISITCSACVQVLQEMVSKRGDKFDLIFIDAFDGADSIMPPHFTSSNFTHMVTHPPTEHHISIMTCLMTTRPTDDLQATYMLPSPPTLTAVARCTGVELAWHMC